MDNDSTCDVGVDENKNSNSGGAKVCEIPLLFQRKKPDTINQNPSHSISTSVSTSTSVSVSKWVSTYTFYIDNSKIFAALGAVHSSPSFRDYAEVSWTVCEGIYIDTASVLQTKKRGHLSACIPLRS